MVSGVSSNPLAAGIADLPHMKVLSKIGTMSKQVHRGVGAADFINCSDTVSLVVDIGRLSLLVQGKKGASQNHNSNSRQPI